MRAPGIRSGYAKHNNSGLDLSLSLPQIPAHMVELNELVVVTAKLLADGAPVYLTASGSWSRALQEAQVVPAQEGEATAAARAKQDEPRIADPYTFKVEVREGFIDALSTRERIRSTGPTVRVRRPD